jgi:hypothetical protein
VLKTSIFCPILISTATALLSLLDHDGICREKDQFLTTKRKQTIKKRESTSKKDRSTGL